ncbi:hypothetical protein DB346_08015 [Verrucomicrobia bacterium LW23]|nr:hypothetical protein DB346_08015 [Verrucomicrobia bacterium LW23]
MFPNITKIEYLLRPLPGFWIAAPIIRSLALAQWKWFRLDPPPLGVKAALILRKAKAAGVTTFVETGTFFGDMIHAVAPHFGKIISIELDQRLWQRARTRFADRPHITLLQGDSGTVLGEVQPTLDAPCLFWLDGHYSGSATARGESDTPIVAELNHIFASSQLPHVILIDDARLFGTAADYPTFEYVRNLTAERRPGWTVTLEDDVICIEPR